MVRKRNKYHFLPFSCLPSYYHHIDTQPQHAGIEKYEVSLESQTADVYTKPDSSLNYSQTLSKIVKTGKQVKAGKEDGEERSVNPADFE